jgi:hypothetical protein
MENKMKYKGSCHCGNIKFEVEGELEQAIECNCTHCSRKGYLLWFVPADKFKLETSENGLSTYQFNKHVINHHFCPKCGCAPFGSGKNPSGIETKAINARCIEGIDLSTLKKQFYDGLSK